MSNDQTTVTSPVLVPPSPAARDTSQILDDARALVSGKKNFNKKLTQELVGELLARADQPAPEVQVRELPGDPGLAELARRLAAGEPPLPLLMASPEVVTIAQTVASLQNAAEGGVTLSELVARVRTLEGELYEAREDAARAAQELAGERATTHGLNTLVATLEQKLAAGKTATGAPEIDYANVDGKVIVDVLTHGSKIDLVKTIRGLARVATDKHGNNPEHSAVLRDARAFGGGAAATREQLVDIAKRLASMG